jgi:hypothetical protein
MKKEMGQDSQLARRPGKAGAGRGEDVNIHKRSHLHNQKQTFQRMDSQCDCVGHCVRKNGRASGGTRQQEEDR